MVVYWCAKEGGAKKLGVITGFSVGEGDIYEKKITVSIGRTNSNSIYFMC
jgi:hypothetical protein